MRIAIPNLKKKVLTTFDRVVKTATARAIPIAKKEAIKQIAADAIDMDTVISLLTAAGVLFGTLALAKSTPSTATRKLIGDTAQTIINIENLNLYLGADAR